MEGPGEINTKSLYVGILLFFSYNGNSNGICNDGKNAKKGYSKANNLNRSAG